MKDTNFRKETILYVCIILFLILLIGGCRNKQVKTNLDTQLIDGFSLVVDSVTEDSITLSFKNNTNIIYGYGATYYLEKRTNQKLWDELSPLDGVPWIQDDWLMNVYPGKESTITYKWDWYYGSIPAGDYRIVVLILEEDNKEPIMLSAEFSI